MTTAETITKCGAEPLTAEDHSDFIRKLEHLTGKTVTVQPADGQETAA